MEQVSSTSRNDMVKKVDTPDIEPKVITIVIKGRTTIDDRLKAKMCELCGRTDVKLEVPR